MFEWYEIKHFEKKLVNFYIHRPNFVVLLWSHNVLAAYCRPSNRKARAHTRWFVPNSMKFHFASTNTKYIRSHTQCADSWYCCQGSLSSERPSGAPLHAWNEKKKEKKKHTTNCINKIDDFHNRQNVALFRLVVFIATLCAICTRHWLLCCYLFVIQSFKWFRMKSHNKKSNRTKLECFQYFIGMPKIQLCEIKRKHFNFNSFKRQG